MTDADRAVLKSLNELLDRHNLAMDDLCEVIRRAWHEEAEHSMDSLVRSCIEAAAEHMSDAGMAWYVSTK